MPNRMTQAVVLVEDDAADALLVREMLSDVAPHIDLLVFPTLQSARDEWPDEATCVLLDLGLPDAYGLSALEALRAYAPETPIVVLTGRVDDASGPEAVAAGAQDFLVKGKVDGVDIERSIRYAIERGRAATIQRDLVAAELRSQENTRLQRGLLPNPLIYTEHLERELFYRPGSERALLGGDFYDIVQTDAGVHLIVGDVSGHGPDEAALGVALRIAWRSLILAGLSMSDVLRGVEQVLLAERNDDASFATVAMVSVAPDLESAQVVLCGHPRPLLVRGREVHELAIRPHSVLSLLEGRHIEPTVVDLADEWGLFLFTDGLVEGRCKPGASERLGVEELAARLQRLVDVGAPPEELAPTLVAEAEECHGGPLNDDVAVMLIGRRGWWRRS